MELLQMETPTAFISAALKPGELISCYPPSGVDLGLGSNGLPSGWKLWALPEGFRPAAMRLECAGCSQEVFPLRVLGLFLFVEFCSGGAFCNYFG
jgi:hypothetical protein